MASAVFTIKSSKLSVESIEKSAQKHGLLTNLPMSEIYSSNIELLNAWLTLFSKSDVTFTYSLISIKPRLMKPPTNILRRAVPNTYTATQIATIYKIPTPVNTRVTIGVVSFGGGLYGNISASGVLTGGDAQAYWTSIGIPLANQPTVIVKPINGATNDLTDAGSTAENTIDVETLGGCCPSSKLTIILYISPNTLTDLYNIFNYIVNTPVVVGSVTYRPTIISCSWGLPELYVPSYIRNNINSLLSTATARGINICTATGDNGSNNGVGGTSTNADFPSSCPYLTAVGGTTLICPNFEYDTLTVETAWSSGGGAISRYFAKPAYQSAITATGRAVPDLALDADPATGVQFILQGQSVVYGGTSVAAPIFAGFLAAINANTFINPIIYNNPTNFNDIKSGSNGAYSAKTGYDFCTGLGSIKGGILGPKIISIPVIATGLSLKPSSVTLFTGQTTTIVPTLAPPNTTNNILSWVSSDPTKVTVTNGVIRALSATTRPVTITVRTTDGSNKSATVSVIVNIAVQSISLNVATARVAVAKTVQLIATILPTSASNKAVTWSTTNSNVTVSNTGLVRGISAGTAIVRVTTVDGAKTASCTITIVIPVVSVSLNPSTITLRVGSRSTIVLPVNASNKAVSWSSSNTAIATVSSGGVVTGVRIGGPVNITVTTVDGGFTGRSVVTVN